MSVGMGYEASQGDSSEDVESELAGKYLTFKLADEVYGVDILMVRELIGRQDITRVPRTPAFIRGVINLRGKVHPVIDLRVKLAMGKAEDTDQTVIIIVQYTAGTQEHVTGIIVDEVLEVLNVTAGQVELIPDLGAGAVDDGAIQGVGKLDEKVVFFLDVGKVLSSDEAGAS